MCSPYDFTRNFQKGISTLDIAEAYMYIWCKTTNFKWINLFLRFFVNIKCFWQSNESSCIWLFDEIFAIVERRKGGNPKRATHAIYYRPLPEVYDGSAKVRQEQEEIQNPSRAKIRERAAPRPLTINHRSSFKTASNPELGTILSWSKSDTASFIELDLANVSRDFCFSNWMFPDINEGIYLRILIGH